MTKRTLQLETAILMGFADGHSLRAMCRALGISRITFLMWMHDDPDLARRYAEMQFCHAEALVDDCIAIADDPSIDLGEGRPGDAPMDEAGRIRRARHRIDARLKVARIYFKRHDAALDRQAREEALLRQIEAEDGPEDAAAPETAATPLVRAAVPGDTRQAGEPGPVRLATSARMPEPELRRAAGAP